MKKVFNTIFILLLSMNTVSAEILPIWDYEYKVSALPGSLNNVPVFNSNSPELVKSDGILLSTFPKDSKKFPNAHLDKTFEGDFDIFTHHIAIRRDSNNNEVFYQGIVLKNPSDNFVTLKVNSSASYLTSEAPFLKIQDFLKNSEGKIYTGPGDRVNQDILRGRNLFKQNLIKIKPRSYYLLFNDSIPVFPMSSRNARTTVFKLNSDSPVYIADLGIYKKNNFNFFNTNDKPNINNWIDILRNDDLAQQRDHIPTPINSNYADKFFYSRVSGVAIGNKWEAKIKNQGDYYRIPEKNSGHSFVVNSVYNNTFGTNQVQSGLMEKRYADTAYQSHGNYGVTYEIEIPLYNGNEESTSVSVSFDSPIRLKNDIYKGFLSYYDLPPEKITFRGEFKVNYQSYFNLEKEKYFHVVQRFGQQGLPLASVFLDPGDRRLVKIKYIYPADCTPPHVFTITSN